MPVWRTFSYSDLTKTPSPTPGYSTDRSNARRTLKVNWSANQGNAPGRIPIEQIARDILGYAEVEDVPGVVIEGDGTKGGVVFPTVRYIRRVTPMPLRLGLFGSPMFWASTISGFSGMGPMGNTRDDATDLGQDVVLDRIPRYQFAKVDLEYGTRTYNVLTDEELVLAGGVLNGKPDEGQVFKGRTRQVSKVNTRYVTRRERSSGKIFTLRGNMVAYDDPAGPLNDKVIPEGVPVKDPVISAEYVWHNVPKDGVPRMNIMIAQGRVNDDWFDGYPPGCALLDAAEPRPEVDPFGTDTVTMTYRFEVLPHYVPELDVNGKNPFLGWNSVIANRGGVARYVNYKLPGNKRAYELFDMSKLFRPD